MEHGVPEQTFSTPTQPVEGVSAVKALQIAAAQGQRIYHITPHNRTATLPNLHLDSAAMNEITDALAVGKEVIAHTDRISVPGWTGEGYVLFDPVTGDGAYKITGGGNGGFMSDFDWKAAAGLFLSVIFAVLSVLTIPAAIMALLSGLTLWAGAAAFLGLIFSVLAVYFGFDVTLLAGARALVASILVFATLAFGPPIVVAPIALSLFIMWVIAVTALEIAILITIADATELVTEKYA